MSLFKSNGMYPLKKQRLLYSAGLGPVQGIAERDRLLHNRIGRGIIINANVSFGQQKASAGDKAAIGVTALSKIMADFATSPTQCSDQETCNQSCFTGQLRLLVQALGK